MKKTEKCSCCGQSITTYKHNMNTTLIWGLLELYKAGGVAKLKDLNLTNSAFANFQKLQYFDLVFNYKGVWRITISGKLFIKGEEGCPMYAMTRLGHILRNSFIPKVYVTHFKGMTATKEEWKAQVK